MMLGEPNYQARKGVGWLLLGLAGGGALAQFREAMPAWVFGLAGTGCVVVGAVGVLYLTFWFADHVIRLAGAAREAKSITPESVTLDRKIALAKELHGMSDKVVDLIALDIDVDDRLIPGTGVPVWFAYEFLQAGTDEYLAARSTYGNMDSKRYKWADELTRYFKSRGYAEENLINGRWMDGNRPARWKTDARRRIMVQWFGDGPHDDDDHSPTAEAETGIG